MQETKLLKCSCPVELQRIIFKQSIDPKKAFKFWIYFWMKYIEKIKTQLLVLQNDHRNTYRLYIECAHSIKSTEMFDEFIETVSYFIT